MFLASSNLTDEQHHIQELARDFAKNEFAPNMFTWDEQVSFLFVLGVGEIWVWGDTRVGYVLYMGGVKQLFL